MRLNVQFSGGTQQLTQSNIYSILFYSRYDFEVRWEPFLLRPQIPKEGVPAPPITKDSQLYVFHITVNDRDISLILING